MKETTYVEATEDEILAILNKEFGTSEDSIVALEELGNQVWVISVDSRNSPEEYFIKDGKIKNFYTSDALDELCHRGVIKAGKYSIDCTW